MQKLHLIGFTTDHDGLILSARKTARSGGYVLTVDDTLAEAVDAYRARQEELQASRNGRPDREESKLRISEIQARLRRGKSVKDIAKDAGVSPEWIERFAAPVFAERAQVVDYVRNAALRRPRLGASAMRVGDAIRHNLADRGVALSAQEFTEGWSAVQQPNGKWVVRFKVRYRGADKTLRYDLAGVGQEIAAKDQLTRQLSYVTPPPKKPSPRPAATSSAGPDDDSKKRAQVSTGFRPEVVKAKPTSTAAKERERAARAMNQAAARRASESEKAAARKARERAQALAKREREAKAEAARREKEAAQRAKEAAAAARAAAAAAAKRERDEAAAAEARRVAREEAREAARQKAIQAVRKRPAAKKATKPKATDKARTAAEVRKRGAAAEEAARTRAAKARPVSATTAAKRATAAGKAPVKAAAKAAPRPTGKPVKAAPPPAKAATKAPAKKAASPVRAGSPLRSAEPPPTPAARVDPAKLGGATDSYGPEAQRALFRAGLAEPASGDDVTSETARPEIREDRPARFMGRRRRRQLRAD